MLGHDFVSILDLTPQSLTRMLDLSLGMKRDGVGPVLQAPLSGSAATGPSDRCCGFPLLSPDGKSRG